MRSEEAMIRPDPLERNRPLVVADKIASVGLKKAENRKGAAR